MQFDYKYRRHALQLWKTEPEQVQQTDDILLEETDERRIKGWKSKWLSVVLRS